MTEDINEIIQKEIEKKGDISEHLLTLKEYASKCEHVTEFGVRWVCSTWALLAGTQKKLVSYDFRPIDSEKQILLEKISNNLSVEFNFLLENVLNSYIEYTDLLFIDTIHSFKQLSIELYAHGWKVKKYIILHDTTTFEKEDEGYVDTSGISSFLKQYERELPELHGLSAAINLFLDNNPEWEIDRVFTNNNGLTILKKNK
jgi:hypothetical protein